jgi:malonyl-CoA/methylmalonyl-CoA synthetase
MSGHFLHTLRRTVAQADARPALVYRDRSYSYAELDARARNSASQFQTLGVEAGDRVVLLTGDKLTFLFAHLGVLYAGGVAVPLNPRFTREELRFFLTDCGARAVVAAPDTCRLVEELRPHVPELRHVMADAEIANAPKGPFHEPSVAAHDPCLILYSSGTTGWPKGVVHNHANVASSLEALRACWRMTPDDRVVNVLPLFHTHGLSFATHLSLLTGACVLLEDSFHPLHTLEVVGRGTVFMAVPTIYYRFLEQPELSATAKGWPQVRLFTCGSAPIRPEVLPKLESILNRPVINRYGMTEAHVITSLPLDGPWPQGSVGLPLPGIEVRVAQEEDRPATADTVGSVLIRGPNLFRGYWNQPDATQAAFRDGWFDTGDLGRMDPNGFLTLVGRKSDLIITNGYNVYPQVVERVINECPGVGECAVVGIPDERRGERVVAVVVRRDPTLDDGRLRSHWNERLVDYQRPLTVLFREELPRNAMGKVARRSLQEEIVKSMKSGEAR